MAPSPLAAFRLELRLRELAQLFNSLDPAPFLHRDLGNDAEEYIESWAMDYPAGSRLQINVHLQQMPPDGDPQALIAEAIHNYFRYKAELTQRELRRLLRVGRQSLLIGLAFLVACLLGASVIDRFAGGWLLQFGRESLTIVGWVAMWRPIQIFLYEWWPIQRRRRVYLALGHALVHVSGPAKPAP
jgi:hypothetical protein